jgi:hypothetical protein
MKGSWFMKNRNIEFAAMMLVLAFALAPIVEARPGPSPGPTRPPANERVNASSENILPAATISFAPIGLTFGQTARLNLVNLNVANGITVSCRFIDDGNNTLSQSTVTLSVGKITSVDFRRQQPLPGAEAFGALRLEVRAEIEVITFDVSSDSLRRSLEVFDSVSGATTVFLGGGN